MFVHVLTNFLGYFFQIWTALKSIEIEISRILDLSISLDRYLDFQKKSRDPQDFNAENVS